MDKEKLKKDLDNIEREIRLKRTEIINSPEYRLLEADKQDLGEEKNNISRELNKLRRPIYLKYVTSFYGWGNYIFRTQNVKSSVKQGIKKGLGITSVAFIYEHDLKNIVSQLIEKDLEKEKIKIDKLESKLKKIKEQFNIIYDNKDKLMTKELSKLTKQAKKIYDKLHEKENLKNQRMERKQKEVKIQIDNHLPKFMDKIIKEVNKRLILENLK